MNKQFRYLFYASVVLSMGTLAMHAESIDPTTATTSILTDSTRSSVDVTLSGLHEIGNIAGETSLITGNVRSEGDTLLTITASKMFSVSAVQSNSNSNTPDEVVAQASADVNDVVDPAIMTVTTSSSTDAVSTAADITVAADVPPTDPSSDPAMFSDSTTTATPEPSTFWLVGSLLLGAATAGRKQMGRLCLSR
jgi:hypothetical protein